MDTTTARKRRYRQRRRAAQLKAYEVWLPAALVDELKQPDESINALVARAMDALRQQAPEAMRPPPATAGLTSEQRKAALVARLRELKAQGLTLQAIANQLNADGEPTLTHKGRWQKGTVGNLLAEV